MKSHLEVESRVFEKDFRKVTASEDRHTGLGEQSVASLGHGIKAHGGGIEGQGLNVAV
jgi:hypothetical protein